MAGIAGIEQAVVPELTGTVPGVRFFGDVLHHVFAQGFPLRFVVGDAGFPGGFPLYDLHHAAELLGAHHGDAAIGVAEEEARLVGPPHHGVVAGAVAGSDHKGDGGHLAVAHGIDEFGAVLDDAAALVFLAHHEAGDVLKKYEGYFLAVAQLDEVRALVGRLAEEHAVIGEYAHGIAVHIGKAGDQGAAPAGLELVKTRAVHYPGDELAHIEGLAHIGREDAQQFLGRIAGRIGQALRPKVGARRPQAGHDLARQADALALVAGQVVAHAADGAVHFGPTQGFVVHHFIGGHFHQGRSGQEDLGLILDEDGVIAHAGHIGPAGCAVAKDHGDGGHTGLGAAGDLAEAGPAVVEDALLLGQVGTGRLHQVDAGQLILEGDLAQAETLLQGGVIYRSALVGTHIADAHAQATAHQPDAAHGGAARPEALAAQPGQGQQFQKGAVAIQQQLQSLAGQHFALAPRPVDVLVLALKAALFQSGFQLLHQGRHARQVFPVGRRFGIAI